MYDFEQMYMAHSIEEAIQLLAEHQDAEIICGGTDVLIKLREAFCKKFYFYLSFFEISG